MIRIPIGNERSMRTEVRAVAPDANPYLVMLGIFKTGLEGTTAKIKNLRQAERYLPDNIYDALDNFRKAEWTKHSARRRRERPLRGPEAGLCRSLPSRPRDLDQSAGSPVPPRSLQPVPLEPVLDRCQICHPPRPKAGAFLRSAGDPPAVAGAPRPRAIKTRSPGRIRPRAHNDHPEDCGTTSARR